MIQPLMISVLIVVSTKNNDKKKETKIEDNIKNKATKRKKNKSTRRRISRMITDSMIAKMCILLTPPLQLAKTWML